MHLTYYYNNKIVVFVGSIPGAAIVTFDVSPNPASTTIDITASNNINELSATAKNNETNKHSKIFFHNIIFLKNLC